MRMIPIILLLSACSGSHEHSTDPIMEDTTETTTKPSPGAIRIQPIHHSSLVLQWENFTIMVDPHDSIGRYTGFPPADLILITDIHGDHLDTTVLRNLDLAKARIVAPPAVHHLLPEDLRSVTDTLRNGEKMETIGITVEALAMYNLPGPGDPRHPKGRGNGYVLNIGGERIYISGDTEDIPEMRALQNIGIAFVCMNLPYTMTVDQAASAVLDFKPRIVYPYHFRGKDGFSDVERFKQLVNAGDPSIEVKLADWY